MVPLLWVAQTGAQTSGMRLQNVPQAEWKQLGSPEQAGWSAKKLGKIRDYVGEIGSTSAMIVQHGVVVAAWGDVVHKSNLHSCRKPAELVDWDCAVRGQDQSGRYAWRNSASTTTAVSHFGGKAGQGARSAGSAVGIDHPAVYETRGMMEEKPARGSHAPGTFWYDNNWDVNALGYIYQRATGTKIF
jgi:hypothetical protein